VRHSGQTPHRPVEPTLGRRYAAEATGIPPVLTKSRFAVTKFPAQHTDAAQPDRSTAPTAPRADTAPERIRADSAEEQALTDTEQARSDGDAGPTEWTNGVPVGVGPWPGGPTTWPSDPRYDPELLRDGDRRNVVDAYRYWRRPAIVADIDTRRHPFHVAIENFAHDHNIGTVVRTANAFAAAAVHIVGRRRWNRRGAMVTDRYQHLHHHDTVDSLLRFAREHDLTVVAVDNSPGSLRLERAELPRACLLLFGQEGPGVSAEARAAASLTVSIAQFGSTRSINAGVASGIAMHAWIRQHADLTTAW
jgi:tRNA(Leu) C34 or U34 (ribose-2'-O)-methylase TrmL